MKTTVTVRGKLVTVTWPSDVARDAAQAAGYLYHETLEGYVAETISFLDLANADNDTILMELGDRNDRIFEAYGRVPTMDEVRAANI